MEELFKLLFFIWWIHGMVVADGKVLKVLCFLMPPLSWCASITHLTRV